MGPRPPSSCPTESGLLRNDALPEINGYCTIVRKNDEDNIICD